MSNILKSLEDLALEVVEKEGFRLYDVEFLEKQRKLIVTIDKAKNTQALSENTTDLTQTEEGFSDGVSINDCVNVSRALNLLLDVENIIPGENSYDLEVSSPGLERALKKLWHFETAVNQSVKVVIKKGEESESFGNLRSFKATIDKVDQGQIFFKDVENSKLKNIIVPFEVIHKANVVFNFGRQKKH